MEKREIILYTMTGCPICSSAREYLTEKGHEFTEHNVLEDDEAMARFKELGFRGTPVTIIDGEAVIGFERAVFDRMLKG